MYPSYQITVRRVFYILCSLQVNSSALILYTTVTGGKTDDTIAFSGLIIFPFSFGAAKNGKPYDLPFSALILYSYLSERSSSFFSRISSKVCQFPVPLFLLSPKSFLKPEIIKSIPLTQTRVIKKYITQTAKKAEIYSIQSIQTAYFPENFLKNSSNFSNSSG